MQVLHLAVVGELVLHVLLGRLLVQIRAEHDPALDGCTVSGATGSRDEQRAGLPAAALSLGSSISASYTGCASTALASKPRPLRWTVDMRAEAKPAWPLDLTMESEAPTAASIFGAAALDPSSLHPLASILDNEHLDYLLLEDDRLSATTGPTALPTRGWADELCYGTGSTYLAGPSDPPIEKSV